jgi:hypothetical protein
MKTKGSAVSSLITAIIVSVVFVAVMSALLAGGVVTLNHQGIATSQSSATNTIQSSSTRTGSTLSSTSSPTITKTQTAQSGNNVTISGSISLSGKGTHGTKITFSGTGQTFTVPISGSTYQLSFPNSGNYSVSLEWKGNFSWQIGTADLGTVSVSASSDSMVKNFQVTTPDSTVTLSGNVTTAGQGTKPQEVIFTTAGSNYIANITNGSHYSLTVPNLSTFTTVVQWIGAYSWQGSTDQAASLFLNLPAASNATTDNILLQTPSSTVQVSGVLALTGSQTNPVNMTFSISGGPTVSLQTNGTKYTAVLPNFATFSVNVGWKGAYSWQSGIAPAAALVVSVETGSSTTEPSMPVSTPNSLITLSGAVTTTGSGTSATGIVFTAYGLHFNTTVTAGKYTVQLPNLAKYAQLVSWVGTYPWQTGSVNATTVTVNQGAGTTQTNNFAASTPASTITVSGTISILTGEHPTSIIFTYSGSQFSATPSGTSYSLSLPNAATYSVSITWTSSFGSGTCTPTPSTLTLQLAAGVTTKTGVNWSC